MFQSLILVILVIPNLQYGNCHDPDMIKLQL